MAIYMSMNLSGKTVFYMSTLAFVNKKGTLKVLQSWMTSHTKNVMYKSLLMFLNSSRSNGYTN